MSDLDDMRLRDAALAGDTAAVRTLVERLVRPIEYRVSLAITRYRSRCDAKQACADLTQQVFLALFEDAGRRLRAWEPGRGASLETFVGLIAEREVVAMLRRDRRNPWTESPTEATVLAAKVGEVGDHEAAVVNRQWLALVLDRALANLDERGLLLFQRLIVDDAPVEAVASEVGSTTAALYMWKSRFSKTVRQLAEEVCAVPETTRPTRSDLRLVPAMRPR